MIRPPVNAERRPAGAAKGEQTDGVVTDVTSGVRDHGEAAPELVEVDLTGERVRELAKHEQVIERGLATFVDVGRSLVAIRDGRLYRAEHGTFETYCQVRWSMERANAYRLIDAAKVVEVVSPTGDTATPSNEAQARELAPLLADPDELRQAYQRAVENTGGKPTAAAIREVVQPRVYPRPALVPEPVRQPRPRRPITLAWGEADDEACRAVNKLLRLAGDNRFAKADLRSLVDLRRSVDELFAAVAEKESVR